MTSNDIWEALCERYPALCKPCNVVEMTAKTLQVLVEEVYKEGRQSMQGAPSCPTELEILFGKLMN